MPNLSYSFHLSKNNPKTGEGHALTTVNKVVDASRHNLRQYMSDHYDRSLIDIMQGSDISILDDVKRIYHEEFDEPLEQYNKGKRSDRIIDDYLEHVSESRSDVGCEIIIQVGDMEFWDMKRSEGWSRQEIAESMRPIFREQVRKLRELVPELRIASVIAHYDEKSPHIHVIGIPVATGYKKGMSKQVAKTKIFTAERLSMLQDRMRENASLMIELYSDHEETPFGEPGALGAVWNIDPDAKQKGRNKDIPKWELDEYYRLKKETEKKEAELKRTATEKQAVEKDIKKLKIERIKYDLEASTRKEEHERDIRLLDMKTNTLETRIRTLEYQEDRLKDTNRKLVKEKDRLVINVDELKERKESLEADIADIENLKSEKEALEKGNRTLKVDKLLLDSDIRKLQKEKEELEEDVTGLKQEVSASQEVIKEASEKRISLEHLRSQIEKAEYDKSILDEQTQEKQEKLSSLSEQIEARINVVEADLSADFMHQMLNDSVTSNLVQETIQQTCNQLGELGYLKVGPDTAVLKINKRSILDHIKDHVTDFISDVKRHISKMLLNHGRTKRRGR